MTIEEAIQLFSYRAEYAKNALESYSEDDPAEGFKTVAKIRLESAEMALAALRAQQEASQNKPLTYNNLLGMVGHSVYCVEHKAFVKICKDHVGMYLVNQDGKCSSYHDNLTFYLCPPVAAKKNENGCKYCRDGDVIVLDSCSAVRIERDGQNYIMGGCDWEHEINYCPMCGRQLRHPPKGRGKVR